MHHIGCITGPLDEEETIMMTAIAILALAFLAGGAWYWNEKTSKNEADSSPDTSVAPEAETPPETPNTCCGEEDDSDLL